MRHLVGEATPELEHLFAGAATVTAKRKRKYSFRAFRLSVTSRHGHPPWR
jgi:hypothetical protein